MSSIKVLLSTGEFGLGSFLVSSRLVHDNMNVMTARSRGIVGEAIMFIQLSFAPLNHIYLLSRAM